MKCRQELPANILDSAMLLPAEVLMQAERDHGGQEHNPGKTSSRPPDQGLAELRDARRQAVREHAFLDGSARQRLAELHAAAVEALTQQTEDERPLRLLLAVARERRETDRHDEQQRHRADAAIRAALDRLRRLDSSAVMSRRAAAELREACGFTRVMISSARGSRWLPDTMRPTDHGDPDAAEFARFAQNDNEIPLARLMPETEMVRHRVPVLVPATGSHAYQPLVQVTRSTSYVAAPIVTSRRVIGFFHADRIGQTSNVSQGDLDSIALFASEFGVLFEHTALSERARQQRTEWETALRAAVDGLGAPRMSLAPMAGLDDTRSDSQVGTKDEGADSRHSQALTERERQVVHLVATGATNQIIAQELVLSVDTVKSHVRNVMRKLHARSRADAVAKYLQTRGASSL
jgi:DNA-binding CsgD family transcriptional regulator